MEFSKTVEILKIDQDERKVFGIFNMTKRNGELIEDLQGDVIETHELENAAYQFVLKSRNAGRNHVVTSGVGTLIESFVFTPEKMEIIKQTLEKAGVKDVVLQPNADFWFGGFYIEDDATWALIKSGEFTSFSIGGRADKAE